MRSNKKAFPKREGFFVDRKAPASYSWGYSSSKMASIREGTSRHSATTVMTASFSRHRMDSWPYLPSARKVPWPAPEQVAVALLAVFHLLGSALLHPGGGEELPAVPQAVLQVELPKGVQLGKGEKQAARPKGVALGVHLPGGAGDAQVVEQPGRQVRDQVTTSPALHQHARQIGPYIVVNKAAARLVDKGQGEGQLHPVFLLIQGPLGAHQLSVVLAQAHGQQVPHGGLLQVFPHGLRQVLGKGVHQPLLQGEQPLLDGEPHRTGGDAFAGGIHVPAALLIPDLVGCHNSVLADLHAQAAQRLCFLAEIFQIHTRCSFLFFKRLFSLY